MNPKIQIIPYDNGVPMPQELEQERANIIKELFGQMERSKLVGELSEEEQLRLLMTYQSDIGRIRQIYRDHTVEFKALTLAYEAVRLAWYAVHGDEVMIREKFERADAALQYLAQHLFAEQQEAA